MTDSRIDGFLDGRLRLAQPARGYRAGADAVMLAAACPARPGQSVLELGCGAGVASLCLGWRVPDLTLTGLEIQGPYADLARANADANAIPLTVLQGDLARPPAVLRGLSVDHVIMNPPYFLAGTPAPDAGRATARAEATPLGMWVDAALRRLRPGGWLTAIQRADRLDGLLTALAGRAGAVAILPIAARPGDAAGRVLVAARKGSRGPLRLLAPLVTHGPGQALSPAAARILRDGAPIDMGNAKVP
ncbi:methyltransferase domain-containing protein [Paracoccus aestuarii]|uniref:Methyltransferase domain-containing protein n=1 Tax=Paracoccus aestuarii TaxID=453842 RepID=A0A418ZUL0_9RHOB|nr:methyltransferase [Paracoccus aestuarii]RJL02810.1 methyltransferase domain-containing protein [Paracoccus aestuarii]WCQ98867.1 methyltransferase [Paracoccus aestuarii]